MTGQKGYALLLLLFVTMLLFLLGSTLLFIALSDLRVSIHLAEADRAFYYAEAGIELLKANLPRERRALLTRRASLKNRPQTVERLGSPRFTGRVAPLVRNPQAGETAEEKHAFLLTAVGRWGNKWRNAEAEAHYFPFGRNAVITTNKEDFSRDPSAKVQGGVFFTDTVEEFDWPDFEYLVERAKRNENNEGWLRPTTAVVDGDEFHRLKTMAPASAPGRWFVDGNLLLDGALTGDGVVVVTGDVRINRLPAGRVVLFAQGEIKIEIQGGAGGSVGGAQSLVLFSGERIVVLSGPGPGLVLRGVLLAPEVELQGVSLLRCHRAVMPWLELVPEELLELSPNFVLKWLETEPEVRR